MKLIGNNIVDFIQNCIFFFHYINNAIARFFLLFLKRQFQKKYKSLHEIGNCITDFLLLLLLFRNG